MTAKIIQIEVAAMHGLTREKLLAASNVPAIVAARNEAMARCRDELGMSFPQIGLLFNKHHTTVFHGVAKHHRENCEHVPGLSRPQRLEHTIARQGRLIGEQARVIGEQARQVAFLAGQVERLREARGCGQGELFEVRRSA